MSQQRTFVITDRKSILAKIEILVCVHKEPGVFGCSSMVYNTRRYRTCIKL